MVSGHFLKRTSEESADHLYAQTAAAQAVEPLSRLLLGPADAAAKKVALAGFASAYPYLFRYALSSIYLESLRSGTEEADPGHAVDSFNSCQSGDSAQWTRVNALKSAVLHAWRNGAIGEKVGAVKVLQRIIQTQSAPASSDPRVSASFQLALVQRTDHRTISDSSLDPPNQTSRSAARTILS